jgi:hypothetical protein
MSMPFGHDDGAVAVVMLVAAFLVVGRDRGADGRTCGSAYHRALPAAEFVADRSTDGAADSAADGRIDRFVGGCDLSAQHDQAGADCGCS